ncbi:MarR family winged helix-turn-helix transcriptional regulator [Nibricoccus aquaticus]|uniref:MarR family winged helix-turn-helix transcriptional regulator n=1 Tax=Nibricoccus aquaticus TaxID=2576891 RepID=UPI001586C8D4|nr:MarR family transcriptional regulator [Nibricoccus aquaticus]
MSATPSTFLAHEALLLASRPAEERRCHALHELLETGHALSHALRTELARASLTESGFRLLACLFRNRSDTLTSSALADTLHLSTAALNQLLSRLELSGLVSRAPAPAGRRALVVSITAKGAATFQTAARRLLAATGKLMEPLASSELESLDHACIRLRENLTPSVTPH